MRHHPAPILDEHWEGWELADDDAYRYLWIHQGFNLRLLAVPKGESGQWGYDHAWCYPCDPEAIPAAVRTWDPDTQDEPTGWHKRPTAPPRRAPNRGQDPEYNRPRCVHGSYLADGCRTVGCPEEYAYRESVEQSERTRGHDADSR